MPTTIALSFPWGRYHGTPWGRNVNEGEVDFPPECWRLLRAFYSVWKNRCPDLDADLVHSVLNALAQPPSYRVPEYVLSHTRHYMPDAKYGVKGGSTDKAFDNFAVFERDGEVEVSWPVALSDDQRRALGALCDALPYVGRAEAVCQARLLDDGHHFEANVELAGATSLPGHRIVRLLVPSQPLDVDVLTMRTVDVRKAKRLDPAGTARMSYAVPLPETPRATPERGNVGTAEAVRFSVVSAALPSSHLSVAIADALRSAAMSRFGDDDDDRSPALAGKDADGRPLQGHRHAHYLAFSADPGRTRGGRLIDTVAVWAPGGLGGAELAALGELRHLRGQQLARVTRPVRLGIEGVGSAEAILPELVGPAREWKSVTPLAPARHGRRNRPWDDHVVAEVGRELDYRGLPPAAVIEVVTGNWLSFRRYRLAERLPSARRSIGVRIRFDEPVAGPIALGALSHFGLGLFQPVE